MALAHEAVLVRSRSATTAVEYAAANLLEAVMLICCEREAKLTADERRRTLLQVVATAKELCELTGRVMPWLDVADIPTIEPAPAKPARTQAARNLPPPVAADQQRNTGCIYAGKWLTTKDAAEALGRESQTLRDWKSKQKGPLQPTKVGGRLMWSGDAICELLREGIQ